MKLLNALCVSILLCVSYGSNADVTSASDSAYRSLRIIEPERNQRIPRPGDFSVIAESEPNLKSGHRVQLFLNGGARGIPNTEGRFSVSGVTSGQHDLQVNIIDQGGGVLKSSAVRAISVE